MGNRTLSCVPYISSGFLGTSEPGVNVSECDGIGSDTKLRPVCKQYQQAPLK